MCGLTGFARPKTSESLADAVTIATELLLAIKTRGEHATGVAAVQEDGMVHLLKKAVSVTTFVTSDPWRAFRDQITPEVTRLIGHTRWSSHRANTHLDEAAHPFIEGKITGAHNGIIRNWRELGKKHEIGKEWINDSQAPFGMMNKLKDPVEVLKQLEGYWALSWTKGASLFLTRAGAPLAVAYVPAMRTMFWNSEKRYLEQVLTGFGVEQFKTWELEECAIYRFDVTRFDDTGAHPDKKRVTLDRRLGSLRDSARPTWKPSTTPSTGYSTQRSWDAREPLREKPKREREPRAQSSAQLTLAKLNERIAKLNERIAELAADIETVRAENEFLFGVVRENGLLDGTPNEGETYRQFQQRIEREVDMEREAIAERRDALEQMQIELGSRQDSPYADTSVSSPVCKACQQGWKLNDSLLPVGDGTYIHQNCIFGDDMVPTGA